MYENGTCGVSQSHHTFFVPRQAGGVGPDSSHSDTTTSVSHSTMPSELALFTEHTEHDSPLQQMAQQSSIASDLQSSQNSFQQTVQHSTQHSAQNSSQEHSTDVISIETLTSL